MSGATEQTSLMTKDLTRDFGRFRALDGLSLTVEAGRVVALLGPNGAGKTTLMRLLMGLIEPTSGQSRVLGTPSRSMPAQVTGRVAGMIEGNDPPGWAKLQSLLKLQAAASPAFDTAFAAELLAERGLPEKKRFGRLSKGQKRWALATLALAARPDVMILDEPADGMDPAARVSLYNHIRDHINNRSASALLATHLIADVQRLADDVAIIHKGSLLLFAPLEELREQVREVELLDTSSNTNSDADTDTESSNHLKVLAQQGNSLWVRATADHDADRLIENRFGSRAIARPINLESFYLALTNEASGTDVESSPQKEAVVCV